MNNNAFYEKPILNSPYEYPRKHWELDARGQPTQKLLEIRRPADFVTPIPKPKKVKGKEQEKLKQEAIVFNEAKEISSEDQKYQLTETIGDA